jgi:hypothetical protein
MVERGETRLDAEARVGYVMGAASARGDGVGETGRPSVHGCLPRVDSGELLANH